MALRVTVEPAVLLFMFTVYMWYPLSTELIYETMPGKRSYINCIFNRKKNYNYVIILRSVISLYPIKITDNHQVILKKSVKKIIQLVNMLRR